MQQTDPTNDTLVCDLTRNLEPGQQTEALTFAYSACRVDADKIGWLPRVVYDKRHEDGELLVLYNNADLVGLVMMSKPSVYGELRCLQIWVRPDARMILHGKALIEKLEELARTKGCHTLRLWCAEDLAANLFWAAIGFVKKGWRYGPAKKARRHLLWMRRVSNPRLAELPLLTSVPNLDALVHTTQ